MQLIFDHKTQLHFTGHISIPIWSMIVMLMRLITLEDTYFIGHRIDVNEPGRNLLPLIK